MTYREIKQLAYDILGDTMVDPKIFSEFMMDAYANMAVRSMNESRILERRAPIALTAGTAEYDLPADFRRAFRVTYDGVQIAPITKSRLNQVDDTWREKTGDPVAYYFENEKIGLYPKPNVSSTYELALDSEYGVLVSSADQEYGFVVDTSTNDGLSFDNPDGVFLNTITGRHLEVFYWATPANVGGEDQPDIPDWAWPGLLNGILSFAYQADTLDRDFSKARAYGMLFGDVKRRVDVQSSNTLPKTWSAKQFSYRRGTDILKDRTRRTYTVPE